METHQKDRGKEIMRYHYAQHLKTIDRELIKLEKQVHSVRRLLYRCSKEWNRRGSN